MSEIASFKVDHTILVPGIYVSRIDKIGNTTLTTFDIRVKRPNFEDCMSPATAHTIEHIGAHFFRNDDRIKNNVVYFGVMGCLTGFDFVVYGEYKPMTPEFFEVVNVIHDMFKAIVDWNIPIPGATEKQCGNFRMNDLFSAQNICANMLVMMDDLQMLLYEYPTKEKNPGILDSCAVNEHVIAKFHMPEITQEYVCTSNDDTEEDDSDLYDEVVREFCRENSEKLVQRIKIAYNKKHGIIEEPVVEDSSTLKPVSLKKLKEDAKNRVIHQTQLF